MNWRKHLVLIVGGGVAVVLLLVALVLLFRHQGRHRDVQQELDAARMRLQQLKQRQPYPSAANVEQTRSNLVTVQTMALELQSNLLRHAIHGEDIQPAQFAPMLEGTSRRLNQRAREMGVVLPPGFAYGFARYAAGELPAAAAVPRLVAQLRSVELLCNLLFQSRVAQLDTLEREEFELATPVGEVQPQEGRRGRRGPVEAAPVAVGIPKVETNELYGVERFNVSFRGRETAVWDVLNAVVSDPVFFVLTDVSMENQLAAEGALGQKKPVAPLGAEAQAGTVAAFSQYPAHEDRVIAGREPVIVRLVIDAYQFHPDFQAQEAP